MHDWHGLRIDLGMPALAIALALAALIGVTLGLLGGGGSILTLPILVYALDVAAKPAIAMSLIVVGLTSLVAMAQHARAGNVRWRIGLLFGVSSMAGAVGGAYVARFIPGTVLLFLFAGMMVLTAVMMLRGKRAPEATPRQPDGLGVGQVLLIIVEGVAVGAFTGLVGAGGGFLVVPALVILGKLDMRAAVGTSLLVISMKSFAGAASYLSHVEVDWTLTLAIAGAATLGTVVGTRYAQRVPAHLLKRGFGWFVLAMGLFIVVAEARKAPVLLTALHAVPLVIWGLLGAAGVAGAMLLALRQARRQERS